MAMVALPTGMMDMCAMAMLLTAMVTLPTAMMDMRAMAMLLTAMVKAMQGSPWRNTSTAGMATFAGLHDNSSYGQWPQYCTRQPMKTPCAGHKNSFCVMLVNASSFN